MMMKPALSSKKPPIQLWKLNTLISLIFVSAYNLPFWSEIIKLVHPDSLASFLFVFSVFLLITLLITILLTLLCYKYTYKFIYALFFLGASSALYFINQYSILIDSDMVQNVFETNSSEAFDFANFKLFLYVLFLGFLPLLILLKIPVKFNPWPKMLIQRLIILLLSFVIIGILLFISYPRYASIARNERHLSHKIIPTNFIFASISYIKQTIKHNKLPLKKISQGATKGEKWQQKKDKTVLILILGETARADHFGINGYNEETTPRLQKRIDAGDIVNFLNVSSCGTSTAVSLPCMFSHFSRADYTKSKAKANENLLDFLLAANFSVKWIDNNTGCKGICDRAQFIDLHQSQSKEYCLQGECYDDILLSDLGKTIINNPQDQVIILHQKGSHGPAYYLRYPEAYKKFTPTCDSNELQACEKQEVVNAYNNTLYYTDHIIDATIALLEKLPDDINTSMLYLSDHGESLGENNIYLHGTPYFMAPKAQTHVPFIVWLSDKMQQSFSIDYNCLNKLQSTEISHDNYFHSVLGLMNVQTPYYSQQLDIFSKCSELSENKDG